MPEMYERLLAYTDDHKRDVPIAALRAVIDLCLGRMAETAGGRRTDAGTLRPSDVLQAIAHVVGADID